MELHIDAGEWASVKIIPSLANFSICGVLTVLEIGFVPSIKLISRYALVSPIPMSSAMKMIMFGFCAPIIPIRFNRKLNRKNICEFCIWSKFWKLTISLSTGSRAISKVHQYSSNPPKSCDPVLLFRNI